MDPGSEKYLHEGGDDDVAFLGFSGFTAA